MGRQSPRKDPDRFLLSRLGNYSYKRRVPRAVEHLDKRAPHVRVSLKTSDLALARAKRDLMEAADDALWASLILDEPQDPARAKYQAAMRRVEALGFTFRSAHVLAGQPTLDDLLDRVETIERGRITAPIDKALLGGIPTPPVTVTQAFDIYCDEIVPDELLRKSSVQKAQWKKVKQRAINNFVALVGDKAMGDITRDDGLRLYRFWQERIAPKGGKRTHSASSGNRDVGNMRVLYDAYFKHIDEERSNPFGRLRFSDKYTPRPPFPRVWIETRILAPGALAGLNDQARGIVLAMVETGARPSEIANATPAAIRLDAPVPHLAIEPRDDPDDPREIKTASSERIVPLVGVTLAAFQRHPLGFPRYRNRENDLSAAVNKFFRENSLFPSPAHKLYSLRHSFEDRMKEGGLDEELRRLLMGHTIDRMRYGSGGSLEWRQGEMLKIALPFDAAVV